MTFFIAEEFHVSGIIAVVVAGILKASRFKKITLLEAQGRHRDGDRLAHRDLYAKWISLCSLGNGIRVDSRADLV